MVIVTEDSTSPEAPTPEKKKVTKLETTNTKDAGKRRLVEYFIVVSSKPDTANANNNADENSDSATNEQQQGFIQEAASFEGSRDELVDAEEEDVYIDDFNFKPTITARFPIKDHAENPLHESVTFFCHPSGNIQLRTELSMPKVHFFVATGGSGQKMYGTCLTIWEPYIITAKPKKGAKNTNNNGGDSVEELKKKEVYLPKCLVILSTYQYLMAFREFLTQLNQLSKNGEMTLPVERYISNFCAEIPAPAPGAFEVQTTILDSVIKIWAPPHNQPIAWVALPFAHLFECLDMDNIIMVWHCLCLERQVLLTSTQLSLLTTCAEIFLSLLFPMRWSHAYIPILPHFLVDMLSAPMPFLCGINKSNLASALCDLSPDCVVVDLDMNLVTLGPMTPALPPLPSQLEADLRMRLGDNVGMVFREARSLTKNDDYSERGLHLPPHIKLMADAMWEGKLCLFDEAFHLVFTPEESRKNLLNGNDTSGMDASDRDSQETFRVLSPAEKMNMRCQSQWDAVQEAFMDSFVYLLRNYRKFLVFPSKENEGAYGGAGFRSKEFVSGQRLDMQDFLKQFIGTQIFDNFITKRLYGSGEADVSFFDSAVDRFLKTQGILSNVDVGGRLGMTVAKNSKLFKSSSRGSSLNNSAKQNAKKKNQKQRKEPLLQSARVHRKLKTIVPPEASGEGLPPIPSSSNNTGSTDENEGGPVISNNDDDDNTSVGSASTQETHSTKGTQRTSTTGSSPERRSRKKSTFQAKAAEILEKRGYRYTYNTFPSTFNTDLFGEPRPLSAAVIAEFDRQKKDAARFRRRATSSNSDPKNKNKNKSRLESKNKADSESLVNPEVATFNLFFTSFASVVGKELMDISENPLILAQDKTILATYTHQNQEEDSVTESETETGSLMTNPTTDDDEHEIYNDNDEEEEQPQQDEEETKGVAEMKATRPDIGGLLGEDDDDTDDSFNTADDEEVENPQDNTNKNVQEEEVDDDDEEEKKKEKEEAVKAFVEAAGVVEKEEVVKENITSDALNVNTATTTTTDKKEEKDETPKDSSAAISSTTNTSSATETNTANKEDEQQTTTNTPRSRFTTSLSKAQIEEAQSTGRAQLALAFEMLTMLKKRGLKADPESYQCLIDSCGRVGDTKKATDLLSKMHEDGIVADGVVYSSLVSAFSAESAWKQASGDGKTQDEDLPEWANSTSIEMDWNKLRQRSFLDSAKAQLQNALAGANLEDDDNNDNNPTEGNLRLGRLRNFINRRASASNSSSNSLANSTTPKNTQVEKIEFYVTEAVEMQIELGENLLEIVYPDISVDTDNETCPRCNFLLSDDHVVQGWTASDSQDYTTCCPNCTQRFVPHFRVQSTSTSFMGSKGPASPLLCERLSPWVLQKEIRTVMADREGIENLLSPQWRESEETKNAVLWWNLILSCMRYRFPFTFLL
eukprot:CAMPEP_0194213988 /NCGR_PEP_ID=MMETSP0156-20130528/14968_1 /TAXON_ID=33649 /ORGANISM="Thalassionema nitzschioides, Strain L26-B" /LENGTH=1426 /DNA_ID=CAMNT_0038942151 /DNA_START=27 /DNA_END=4304 /DNA_ORIENTATION=-